MGNLRYEVDQEKAGKWLVEQLADTVLDNDSEAIKVTITDTMTRRSVEAVGGDYEEALERACDKMGIDLEDLDEEVDDD